MNKGIIELIVDETILKLLDEVQNTMIEVLRRSSVVRERSLCGDIRVHDLFGKDVFLVKKEHDRCIGKGAVIANRAEKLKGLHHSVGTLCLGKGLVILREGGNEDNSVNVIEAVDPLPTLGSLPADIIHFEVNAVDAIALHDNLGRTDTPKKNVLCSWLVRRGSNPAEIIEVFLVRIDNVHGSTFTPHFLHCIRLPKDTDGFHMLQELLRVVVGSKTSTGALSNPILNIAIGILRRRRSVVDEMGNEFIVRLTRGCAAGVLLSVFYCRARFRRLRIQRLLQPKVAQMGAKLPQRYDDVRSHDDTIHSKIIIATWRTVQNSHLLEDS
mmetsp:Transcript_61441/g.181589  ORF Transcript_61441/g.181589 Transcript_61441/m.181589 type:complete len:326 (+) Transcript_61441:430-1407(+)